MTQLAPQLAPPAGSGHALRATALGATAMSFVGGSVAVSGLIADAPLSTVQAVRYAVACVLLVTIARMRRTPVPRPRGREWLWLAGVVGTGLVLFNIALVRGGEHAEPAVLAVAVACVPLVLALVGPLTQRRWPTRTTLLGATVVTAGAVVVEGGGRADATGLAWAAVVLACEAGFTLLAVPVLGRLGAHGVSVHTTWMAAACFAVLGVVQEGPTAVTRVSAADWAATAYLAVGVTALAFVLWYSCVGRLAADRAGLLTGVAPVAAALTGLALGGPLPRPEVWVGIALVACGLAVGLAPGGLRSREGRSPAFSRTRLFCTAPPLSSSVGDTDAHQSPLVGRFVFRRTSD